VSYKVTILLYYTNLKNKVNKLSIKVNSQLSFKLFYSMVQASFHRDLLSLLYTTLVICVYMYMDGLYNPIKSK